MARRRARHLLRSKRRPPLLIYFEPSDSDPMVEIALYPFACIFAKETPTFLEIKPAILGCYENWVFMIYFNSK
jgi:hypothetical protein